MINDSEWVNGIDEVRFLGSNYKKINLISMEYKLPQSANGTASSIYWLSLHCGVLKVASWS